MPFIFVILNGVKNLRSFIPPFKDNVNQGEAGLRMAGDQAYQVTGISHRDANLMTLSRLSVARIPGHQDQMESFFCP
jgi:hypothetical protein